MELSWRRVPRFSFHVGFHVLLTCGLAGVLFLWRPELFQRACPIRQATGWPCLSCGGTRSFFALLDFDLVHAFLLNPLVFFLVLLSGAVALFTMVQMATGYKLSLNLSDQNNRLIRVGIVILCGLAYIHIVLTHIPESP